MADLNQLVNPHGPFYESVYQRVSHTLTALFTRFENMIQREDMYFELDPSGTGIVTSGPVVELLKTSGLPTQLLGLVSHLIA